jgi:pimeloyl-ACP methyl ester carboxylesterase
VSDLAVRFVGSGPRVVLLHGGIGPELAWERQEPLAERFQLVIPWRRGYGDSPPAERQDFELDAADALDLIGESAHLVGFSWGGLGAAIAAGRVPERIRSLTLIEPPFFALAPDDPDVQAVISLSARFFSGDPQAREQFLRFAGIADIPPERQQLVDEALRASRSLRPPLEAEPDWDAIRAAQFPVLVVSGDHNAGVMRVCDAIAERSGGDRLTVPGARHAVQRSPGFNEALGRFLATAGASRPGP